MAQDILFGLITGAAGTAVLNIVTYLDMTFRGRPESEVPAKVAGTLLHIPDATPERQHRRSALGALFGYVVGLGIGLVYGLIRSQVAFGAWGIALAGLVIGLAAMLASDLPAIATKATDIGSWGVSGFLLDLIPHLAYGFTVAYTFEWLQ